MRRIFGIDLGTTFSSIAFVNEYGKPEIIKDREGERLVASVVYFDGGKPIVGGYAKRAAASCPDNLCEFVKRHMGNPNWQFVSEDGETYSSEDISAFILKRLKEDAETRLGEPVSEAVITVPAYFTDAQRKATQDAGRIAGLEVPRIINEPTAAALAYGLNKGSERQVILIFDLGGGTFDVTIMKIAPGALDVVATGGDKNLGGFNWDSVVMNYLDGEFVKRGGKSLLGDRVLAQALREKAEIAKKSLSTLSKTQTFISAFGVNATIPLGRDQFEEMTKSLTLQTGTIMELVLEDSKLKWGDIDKILLVGGSTRMPAIPALVEEITGNEPSRELNPDEVVALGAAIQGALIQVERGDIVERSVFPIVIRDVCSHSLGVIAVNDEMKDFNSIVLPKNTGVPCKVSKTYYTIQDGQREIHLEITESESMVDTEANVPIIAEAMLKIPQYPKGAPMEVFIEYDENQIVRVSVMDLTAKKMIGEMQIMRYKNLTDGEISRKQERAKGIKTG